MGGARWDDWRTRCHFFAGAAASPPMCQLAWRSGCSEGDRTPPSSGGPAAAMPPSTANGAAVEPLVAGCAAASPLRALPCTYAFSGPASGMAGDRGGDLAGAAPSEVQRSDLQTSQFVKLASFTRSVKEARPAIPGHGKGPLWSPAPAAPAWPRRLTQMPEVQ